MTQPQSNLGTDPSEHAPRQAHAPAGDQEGVLPNLTSCDLEPITRLERIQSFGFLLAVSRTWVVDRASANLEGMLGITPAAAFGTTLDSFADSESLHEIRNRMTGLSATGGVERLYGVSLINGRAPFDIAIHDAGEFWVLEGEPAGLDSRTDAASLVRKMVARLNTHASLDAFHQDAARQVRSLTGFDRIMIYRFLPDGAGEVIAEVMKPGKESFLGLRYPASDIPVQARALYLRNSFRIIADVCSITIPLLSRGDAAAEPLDLSLAITRAVSTVHIEYLRNMGVAASLSISIVVEGKLWGLIACHHDTAKLPTFVTRTAAELFGQMYSMTLESRLRLIADQQDRRGRQAVARMVKLIASNRALLTDPGWLQIALREVIQCDGIAITINGATSTCGATPSAIEIESIAKSLNALSPGEVFASDNLGPLRPSFPAVSIAAGALCIPMSLAAGDYIMLFRGEQLQDIRWAGAPGKATAIEDDQRISPRKSFAAFCESVRGHSLAFTEPEQKVAGEIRAGLMEILVRGSHENAVEQSLAGGRQEVLIAELNHRVRNVLALIRGLISQTHGEGGDSAKYVESLSGRVQALARAHDRVTRQNWGPGPLNAIFDDEIAAYVPTQRDRFTISGPRILLAPQAYSAVALIVHELVTNSSKYGALSDRGRVEVILNVVPGEGLRIKWREMGGPVVSTPTRRGFGSVIIERVVPFDLQGTALVSYLPAGLEAEFCIPERHLDSADEAGLDAPAIAPALISGEPQIDNRPLAGFNVLIVEDNLIVALEAEDLLRSLGAASLVAVSTIAAAERVCATTSIDFALLDINLGFENSLGFAASLRAGKTPFLFASGYGEQRKAGASRLAELTVSKPYDREALHSAIALTLARVAT